MENSSEKSNKLSFKLNSRVKRSITTEHLGEEEESTDFIVAISDKLIKSTKPLEKSKALVIVCPKNKEFISDPATDSIEAQALNEVLKDSRDFIEGVSDEMGISESCNSIDGIESNNATIARVGEISTLDDYSSVPIDQYGMAMLRGMGYKTGKGIGMTFQKQVKPLEAQLRPKGLGLGANKRPLDDLLPSAKKSKHPGVSKGCKLFVVNGTYKNKCGIVEGVDGDLGRLVVRLTDDSVVTLSQFSVEQITDEEYQREFSSHNLSRGKVGDYVEDQTTMADSTMRKNGKTSANSSHCRWLRNGLRVRIIDKSFRGGKCYNTKVVVNDVSTPTSCMCRTPSGDILPEVWEHMLETVIPRDENAVVLVLDGQYKGELGRIVSKNKKKYIAHVQLLDEISIIFPISFDLICEFVSG